MKKSILILSILAINTINSMNQEELNRKLLDSVLSLDADGIKKWLCAGADKHSHDGCLPVVIRQRPLIGADVEKVNTGGSVELTNLVMPCKQALEDYPEKLVKSFNAIDEGIAPNPLPEIWLHLGIVNGIDYKEYTAIHRAIRLGEQGDTIVKKLIGIRGWFNSYQNGTNGKNSDGDTPLHLVMKTERSNESKRRMCLFLVSRGADASIKNMEDKTPITLDPMFWRALLSSQRSERRSIFSFSNLFNWIRWF